MFFSCPPQIKRTPTSSRSTDGASSSTVQIDNLECTKYNSICQANVVLIRRLEPGRYYDFRISVRDTRGGMTVQSCSITATNYTTPHDLIFPHKAGIIMVPEVNETAIIFHLFYSIRVIFWTRWRKKQFGILFGFETISLYLYLYLCIVYSIRMPNVEPFSTMWLHEKIHSFRKMWFWNCMDHHCLPFVRKSFRHTQRRVQSSCWARWTLKWDRCTI